uniref:18S rRNA (pseudouridine-N1)-methyltransferase n=2 Tax=Anopheles atroparvus TaxID=41427 RepID=A0AAG5CUG1_ANOAO
MAQKCKAHNKCLDCRQNNKHKKSFVKFTTVTVMLCGIVKLQKPHVVCLPALGVSTRYTIGETTFEFSTKMGKRKLDTKDGQDDEYDLSTKHIARCRIKADERRLIVILEGAQLETVKVGQSFELLNCDDHTNILKRNNRDPGSCRPDITHQSLLMLMDSPLNRAGLLLVFLRTERNVLIQIDPQTRIPRTFKRFAGLMVQLLHKLSIKASDTQKRLMKVIKNPISDHLPVGCRKIAMSFSSKKVNHARELVPAKDEPLALVVGAFAHGNLSVDYTEDTISISNYPLSAALTCTKLCSAFEEVWGIV